MRTYLHKNVYKAALERIAVAFENFDNVLVAFSGGKDSGICVSLCYQYAREHGLLHKLAVYHQDYEAGYPQTFEYIERVLDSMPEVRRYWLCLPVKAACAVSMHQTSWIPWHPEQKKIWVREIPDKSYTVTQENIWYPFQLGTSGFDCRIEFAREFAKKHGTTAVIVGLRAEESLSRQGAITSNERVNFFNGLRYTVLQDDITCNFYPIYDWSVEDVWTAVGKFQWDYNKLYDLFYWAGLTIHQMRTASPFHACGQKNLALYRVIAPDMWGKMVSRVNGVNFCAIYGGTAAMGWRSIKKPKHLTWEEYAKFLLSTLPDETKATMEYHLARIMKEWETKGHGRNPRVIARMEAEGIVLEKTGELDKKCTKPDIYEIVKIKSGMPDETAIPMFRKVPSWKGVCLAILKNDFTCQSFGVGRSKAQIKRRSEILKKYKNL
jgi:predicted phosphoadenosine phosphosulfate sulfurtransferase